MVSFTPKKLPLEETAGEKLRQARLFKGLKIDDIAKRTGIRAEYLVALEEERFDRLPTGLYGKNFLKEYAVFLGLKLPDILKRLEEGRPHNDTEDPFSQKIVKKNKFIIFPKIIRNSLIIIAVLICFLYLIFYFKKIILPPDLTVSQPAKNLLIRSTAITVIGQTESEAEVRINSAIVLNNHGGYFSQEVNLKKGLNSLVISAKKKYSREQVVVRQILVE
jgi:cytoskeletal protein RodZ